MNGREKQEDAEALIAGFKANYQLHEEQRQSNGGTKLVEPPYAV